MASILAIYVWRWFLDHASKTLRQINCSDTSSGGKNRWSACITSRQQSDVGLEGD